MLEFLERLELYGIVVRIFFRSIRCLIKSERSILGGECLLYFREIRGWS